MDDYRLPRQHYKCGNSPTGSPCTQGPLSGRCSQSHLDAIQQEVCRPLRTILWWSRSIQIATTLVALIAVSLAWSNIGGMQVVAPGPLSRSHAQIFASAQLGVQGTHGIESENRCAACHSGLDGAFIVADAPTQSRLCLNCHSQEMPNAVHGSPHDLRGKSFEELVARGDGPPKSTWAKLASRFAIDWQDSPTECSQCHREHQGESHDLNAIASVKCQTCHRNQFHSFSTDHPEFKNYPYGRLNSIAFDHVKHRDLHFSKKAANFDCKTCHVETDQVGVVGQVFRGVSFEQACASCHSEPIKSATQDGLIVLQIPSINRRELQTAGTDIGNWPTQSSQLTDGVIPPIMRLLIESEPGGIELLNELPTSGRLVELEKTDERARTTLLKLSELTKRLLQKLANDGQPGFRSAVERLVSTVGPVPRDANGSRNPWLDRFASGIPPDLFRAAWYEWFNDVPIGPVASLTPPENASAVRLSSSIRSAEDDLLLGNESLLNSGDDALLSGDPSSQLSSQAKGNFATGEFKDSRAWDQLAFGGWMIDRQRMAIVYVPNGHADEWLSRWIELEEIRPDTMTHRNATEQPNRIAVGKHCRQCHLLQASQRDEPMANEHWNVSFRQANQNQLGHELMASADGSNACWKATRRAANLRQITKFDHTPHLTLPTISDCRSCHRLEPNSGAHAGTGSASLDASIIHSESPQREFARMQKALCAGCHQPRGAGESCTQCHNYHVSIQGWLESR